MSPVREGWQMLISGFTKCYFSTKVIKNRPLPANVRKIQEFHSHLDLKKYLAISCSVTHDESARKTNTAYEKFLEIFLFRAQGYFFLYSHQDMHVKTWTMFSSLMILFINIRILESENNAFWPVKYWFHNSHFA